MSPASRSDWAPPMLATLSGERVTGKNWVVEIKFDGVRCLASRQGNSVVMNSRNRLPMNGTYPEIADALAKQKSRDFIVDGEIVAFKEGLTSFAQLQRRMKEKKPPADLQKAVPVHFYLFDLLHLDGKWLTGAPLLERKKLLKTHFGFKGPLHFSRHLPADTDAYYEHACKSRWEGLIAKKIDSPYSNARSSNWLKVKCLNEQEFVIGGYTEPQNTRSHFGALLLGHYEGRDLIYAGKVGTGFDEEALTDLSKKFKPLRSEKSPFKGAVRERGARWLEPKLVGQVAFGEWTDDGKLRHSSFRGLRDDKPARDVRREKKIA